MRPTAPRRLSAAAAGLAVAALLALLASGTPGSAETAPACGPLRTSGTSGTRGGGALMVPATLDQATDQSSLVFVGTVTAFQSCTSGAARSIHTYVTLAPERVLKGSARGPVRLMIPGGAVGAYGLEVGTSPEFTAGERAVVFAAQRGSDAVPVQGYQGKLDVTPDGRINGASLTLDRLAAVVRRAADGTLTSSENFSLGETTTVSADYMAAGPKWPASEVPVARYMNVNDSRPAQLGASDVRKAIVNALHTWQNVPGAYIAFGPILETGQTSAQGACDGFNNTSFGISDPSHPSGTLAVTYTCWNSLTLALTDADVEIDVDHFGPYWRTGSSGTCYDSFDLQTVLLHEFGHALGLGHPSSTGDCIPCPVMDASYGGMQRTLCPDDAAGVNALYPLAPGSPPPQPPIGAANRNGAITVAWGDVPGELGYEIWRAPLPCSLALPIDFALADTTPVNNLSFVDNDHGNGLRPNTTYCYEVRSFNTSGESAFSGTVQSDGLPVTPTFGDANCDGAANAVDALGILRHVSALTGGPACIADGDVNCSGSIEATDALRILRYVAGLQQLIPC